MSTAVLRPLDAAGFEQLWRTCTAEYAAERVRAGQWPEAQALARAQAEFAALLPQGSDTPGHHCLAILDPDLGVVVGHLWWAEETRDGQRVAYVYDLAVQPAWQRRGHARRAFLALEGAARAAGLARIDLHVFGHNPGAQAFYAALGYRVTSVMMARALQPDRTAS